MITSHDLSDRERELLTLAALGELSHAEAEEWQHLTKTRPELLAQASAFQSLAIRLSASASKIPEAVRQRLDAVRSEQRKREPRIPTLWRKLTVITLPLAAAVTLGFFLLQEADVKPDLGIKSGPVTFPEQAVQWIAPGAETGLLQPTLIWKGTPGQTYHLQILDASGRVLAEAEGVQSPWLVDQPLPAAVPLTIQISTGKEKASTTHPFQIKKDAVPLASDLFTQMQNLAAAGQTSDALMLLMRLPEDALTPEEYAVWKKKLK